MRAFSLYFDQLPVIMVNGADGPRGRMFSLLHERRRELVNRVVCWLNVINAQRLAHDVELGAARDLG
jgi:hypothetical protein